jgi:hypothetical protein
MPDYVELLNKTEKELMEILRFDRTYKPVIEQILKMRKLQLIEIGQKTYAITGLD